MLPCLVPFHTIIVIVKALNNTEHDIHPFCCSKVLMAEVCIYQTQQIRQMHTDRETHGRIDTALCTEKQRETDTDNILYLTLIILLSVSSSDVVWATRNDPRNFPFCFRIFSHWTSQHINISHLTATSCMYMTGTLKYIQNSTNKKWLTCFL